MISRQTARKVRIWDITNGEWVKREGFEPNVVKTPNNEEVSRTRILGTIVSKFVGEDGNYASLTIDDGTDTIRLKFFKVTGPAEKFDVGDIVDVIGKVREFDGEIYITPEIIRQVDINYELLRRLELIYKLLGMKKAKELIEKNKTQNIKALKEELMKKYGLESHWIDMFIEGGQGSDNARLKDEIMKVLSSQPDGILYSDLVTRIEANEADLENAVNELLKEGICYEPSPGKIKKI